VEQTTIARASTEAAPRRRSRRERLRALFPLDSGPQEIRSLDGLRAVAALLVVSYHAIVFSNADLSIAGIDLYPAWNYGRTGVQLFFVLSGFLLFLPYARAMLLARPLPSARQFYRRRILRIVPAYWVCLVILVAIGLPTYLNVTGLANFATHLLFIHNLVPAFDSSIQGPFWTMAVEAQFYLLLPGIAWLLSRVVGRTGSVPRTLLAVCGVIVVAEVSRLVSAIVTVYLPQWQGAQLRLATDALLALNGSEGRFLETFGVGMFCAVLYVARSEGRLYISPQVARASSWLLGIGAFAAAFGIALRVAIRRPMFGNACYACLSPHDVEAILGPLLLGIAYGLLLLAILLSTGALRRIFSFAPLRFLGLISYSLYLWHLPLIIGSQPFFAGWAPVSHLLANLGVATLAVGVAYLSYQVIERPFLQRRRARPAPQPTLAVSAAPTLGS
jgi:peptidoglycan/LPS O-acetylase OafA/YrhL